jgi:hypothetical protein
MASQKPPVAFVIKVTLIGFVVEPDAAGFEPSLPPHALISSAAAPRTASALNRVDTCCAPLCWTERPHLGVRSL